MSISNFIPAVWSADMSFIRQLMDYDEAYRMNVEWDMAHEDGITTPLLDGAL